ncbi:MAG: hypothetical protein M3Y65_17105 [Pseudomonadota bacterium]|nr:hypothetical protein [Pseudomonadota bacterium]
MWHPLDDAYAQAGNAMSVAWRDADEAAMRFHYLLRFGISQPVSFTPIDIQRALLLLAATLEGKQHLRINVLMQYARLALAFKPSLLDRYTSVTAYPDNTLDHIATAVETLLASCRRAKINASQHDWQCQYSKLEQLALDLEIRIKAPILREGDGTD